MTEALTGGVDAPAEHSGAPIDVDTPSTPHALGSQIPPQPEKVEPEVDKAPKSAGEAIRRANEALKAKEAAAPKVEAKEPVKAEVKAEAKPAEPVKAPAARAEDGKFAPKEDGGRAFDPVKFAAREAIENKLNADRVDVPKSQMDQLPPARFSPDAKVAWETAPEPVKAEVHRAIRELEQGHQKYKADSERFDKVREYDDLARKNGREGVHESLKQVVEIENAFSRSPIEGFQKIADHFGISLRAVAAHVMGQTPDQVQQGQDNTIASLKQELASLKQQLGGVTQTIHQQKETETLGKVQAFANEHPRFNELSADIEFFLKSGRTTDLSEAYELAERLNPAPAQASTPPQVAATPEPLNPAGQKSISGAPATGSDPTSRKSGPVPSIRESLNRAKRNLG